MNLNHSTGMTRGLGGQGLKGEREREGVFVEGCESGNQRYFH